MLTNIFVGFAFTGGPIEELSRKGFDFIQDDQSQSNGYQSFTAGFLDSNAFQIREILEEQEYLKFHPIERFAPLQVSSSLPNLFGKHANGAVSLKKSLGPTNLAPGSLRTYFEIRKTFSIWALHIECKDFSRFVEMSEPDQIFDWNSSPAALIHLGPNCFDLVVTQQVIAP